MFPVTFHLTDLLLCCWTFVLLSYVYISISVCFCSVLSQLSLTTGNDRNTVSTSVAGCTQFESDSIHCTVLRSQAAYGPKRKNWNVWCHTCFGCGWFFWKSGGMEEHASQKQPNYLRQHIQVIVIATRKAQFRIACLKRHFALRLSTVKNFS